MVVGNIPEIVISTTRGCGALICTASGLQIHTRLTYTQYIMLLAYAVSYIECGFNCDECQLVCCSVLGSKDPFSAIHSTHYTYCVSHSRLAFHKVCDCKVLIMTCVCEYKVLLCNAISEPPYTGW